MKKITVFVSTIAILSIVLSLCGCTKITSNTSVYSENIEQITNITDNQPDLSSEILIEDTEINIKLEEAKTFPTNCKIYYQKKKIFTEQQLIALFDENPQRTDRSTYDWVEYITENQRGTVNNENSLTFYSQEGNLYDSVYFYYSENPSEDTKLYTSQDGELDFASREDILEKVNAYMNESFGITPDEWEPMHFCAVKKTGVDYYKNLITQKSNEGISDSNNIEQEKAKQQAEAINKLPSKDFYYIKLRFTIDNIPTYWGNVFNYGADTAYSVLGPQGYLVCTEKGVEYIALYFVNEMDTLVPPEEVDVIGSDKALELIMQKYNDIIVEGEIEICDIYLIYLPMPKNDLDNYYQHFEARPFYAFECKQTISCNDGVRTFDYISYIDAVTGKDLGVEH